MDPPSLLLLIAVLDAALIMLYLFLRTAKTALNIVLRLIIIAIILTTAIGIYLLSTVTSFTHIL